MSDGVVMDTGACLMEFDMDTGVRGHGRVAEILRRVYGFFLLLFQVCFTNERQLHVHMEFFHDRLKGNGGYLVFMSFLC
jgi:hypothetical protein